MYVSLSDYRTYEGAPRSWKRLTGNNRKVWYLKTGAGGSFLISAEFFPGEGSVACPMLVYTVRSSQAPGRDGEEEAGTDGESYLTHTSTSLLCDVEEEPYLLPREFVVMPLFCG